MAPLLPQKLAWRRSGKVDASNSKDEQAVSLPRTKEDPLMKLGFVSDSRGGMSFEALLDNP
ncbi:hypothetical protein GCM10007919_15100 [Rhizobium indigoferae]|nr:hypothetical protein GCM10007919_15100 [Rhizobium indigoferae]